MLPPVRICFSKSAFSACHASLALSPFSFSFFKSSASPTFSSSNVRTSLSSAAVFPECAFVRPRMGLAFGPTGLSQLVCPVSMFQ